MSKSYENLIGTLEERAAYLREANAADLYWVLLDDAADAIKVLSGKQRLDTLLVNAGSDAMEGAADQLDRLKAEKTRILDRLVFIANVLDHDDDASLQWVYTEIEAILSGEKE